MRTKDILYWRDKYNKEEDLLNRKVESDLGKKFRKTFYIGKSDLVKIIKWKFQGRLAGRQKVILNRLQDDNSFIISVTKEAFGADSDEEKIRFLSSIKGVGNALSSVILAFYDPENYGVLDIHAWREIFQEKEPPDVFSNPKQAIMFFRALRKISRISEFPCREIEKALFKKNLDESKNARETP